MRTQSPPVILPAPLANSNLHKIPQGFFSPFIHFEREQRHVQKTKELNKSRVHNKMRHIKSEIEIARQIYEQERGGNPSSTGRRGRVE